MDISKQKLQESLDNIQEKKAVQKDRLKKTAKAKQDLVIVEQTTLLEMARLEGEERAVKLLLSTFEPPIEGDKKL